MHMGKARILNSGFYSSIQDLGRLRFRNLGVPHSGAMDLEAAALSNQIVGNAQEDAVLEMTLKGVILQFDEQTTVCVVGVFDEVLHNNRLVEAGSSIQLQAQDTLKLGRIIKGHFAYLAIQGGWQTDRILDSRSMYKGITKKAQLDVDDLLHYLNGDHDSLLRNSINHTNLTYDYRIPAHPGPEYHLLPLPFKELLQTKELVFSSSWNRMAYTFHTRIANIIPQIKTAPVLPGTVQLTPSGDVVVLMRDAQSTGGYPRILQLDKVAVSKLARISAGEHIKFVFNF